MANDLFGFGGMPNMGVGQAGGIGQFGSGLAGMFGLGQKSPSGAANKYLDQIPGKTGGYFDPYNQAGQSQLGGLEEQYQQLLGNPGQKLNDIGSNYQQSPGFQFAMQQALQGAGHGAAAGGMAGSPQHEQENMGIATGLANQDYNNWLGQATGLYGQGLSGSQGLAGMGLQAGTNQANLIAQQLAQKAQNAQQEQAAKNQGFGSSLGNLIGGAFSFL